ncbi:AlpA family phage regulatory protein [Bradyrhizobium diazoefficiens]|nr:AlpA family phage regulatory protein [Bradyrhizobium diazoefficiens]MBR0704560.1 AlpA family phage regulatory protein [Bradyrhizobium diazoefficiens]MBR0773128.1 AlpA family phage regulatory protein [Bradyrhizobium diazoefficiens]
MNSSSSNDRLLRLSAVLAPAGPIPVSKSTWWAGVKSGRFPKPVKLGPRITAWRAEEIQALVVNGFSLEP